MARRRCAAALKRMRREGERRSSATWPISARRRSTRRWRSAPSDEVTILAGGTDVYPAKAARAGWGDMRHPDVLDISASTGLRGIEETATHCRFGALTTWTDLRARRLPPLSPAIRRRRARSAARRCRTAARSSAISAPPRRPATASRACWRLTPRSSLPAAERPPHRAVRRVSSTATAHTLCRPDEIVTALLVPKPAPARAAVSEARRAALSGHLHRHGGRRRRGRCGRRIVAMRASRSAPARRWRSGCRALEAALIGQPRFRRRRCSSRRRISPRSAPIDDIRALRRLSATRRRCDSCATCSRGCRRAPERRAA